MDFIKLLSIFAVIMILILMKVKLRNAIIAAIACTIMLFRVPLLESAALAVKSVYEPYTLMLIGSFILVTFIQRIMEKRKLLERAELALQRISGDRRLVCVIAPVVIGFLPSVGAVNICGDIVDGMIGDDMTVEEKTFVTSYYRHISESFSPTYNAILLALSITLISTEKFVILMAPMVVLLLVLGYIFFLRKIDKGCGAGEEQFDKKEEVKQLLYCFWPLLACILIVIIFNLSVLKVLPFIILLSIFVYKLSLKEVWEYAKTSFEWRIIGNTIILMILKNILTYTGVVSRLPEFFEQTSLPAFLTLGIIMFIGTFISGATAMIVLLLPLAFQMIPTGGAALLMYLMAISYASMQLSPPHICLTVITEYFQVEWGKLIRKTLPVIFLFLAIVNVYYIVLQFIGIH